MANVRVMRLVPDCGRIATLAAPEESPATSRWKDVRMPPRVWRVRLREGRLSRQRITKCEALLEDDIPFAIAIGVCVASSLVLPPGGSENGAGYEKDGFGGPDDIRSAAMGIISFIPFFNWLAWVFAWLDTRRTRYLVYAIVYAAPYLKNDFSLSPDDSWLPLASLAACIVHVQLDTNNAGFELADNESSSDSNSGEKSSAASSLLDKLPVKPFLRQMEKLLVFSQSDQQKVRSRKPAEETSEEDRAAEKEIQEWPETELHEWDKKLGTLRRQDGNDEEQKQKGQE